MSYYKVQQQKEPVMKSEIITHEHGIDIDITDVEGKKDQLLEAFHECSEGRCTCPTQEYEKMETLRSLTLKTPLNYRSGPKKVLR